MFPAAKGLGPRHAKSPNHFRTFSGKLGKVAFDSSVARQYVILAFGCNLMLVAVKGWDWLHPSSCEVQRLGKKLGGGSPFVFHSPGKTMGPSSTSTFLFHSAVCAGVLPAKGWISAGFRKLRTELERWPWRFWRTPGSPGTTSLWQSASRRVPSDSAVKRRDKPVSAFEVKLKIRLSVIIFEHPLGTFFPPAFLFRWEHKQASSEPVKARQGKAKQSKARKHAKRP